MNNKKFYGYEHGADGKLVINEEQAAVVRKIFKWYTDGESVVKLIKHLSEEHIPSPRGNDKWSKKAAESRRPVDIQVPEDIGRFLDAHAVRPALWIDL